MDITYDQVVNIVIAAVVLAGAVASITPTEHDDNVVKRVRNVLAKLGIMNPSSKIKPGNKGKK